MDRLINPINLQGLSEAGRLDLRTQVYNDNKKSFLIAVLFLLGPLLFGAHRYYLGQNKVALLIIGLNICAIVLSFVFSNRVIFQMWIFLLFSFEIISLGQNVKRANTNLNLQLDKELNYDS